MASSASAVSSETSLARPSMPSKGRAHTEQVGGHPRIASARREPTPRGFIAEIAFDGIAPIGRHDASKESHDEAHEATPREG
jgi:hypothetical protein